MTFSVHTHTLYTTHVSSRNKSTRKYCFIILILILIVVYYYFYFISFFYYYYFCFLFRHIGFRVRENKLSSLETWR